jgi:hypothetical protein
MKVRVIVTVDINPDKWESEYGDRPKSGDVWGYYNEILTNAIHTSGARYTVEGVTVR